MAVQARSSVSARQGDALGRICDDQQTISDSVSLAAITFQEAGCWHVPFSFANDESRVAFFDLKDRDPNYAAHEDFKCTVTVMSGLPGAGKDTGWQSIVPAIQSSVLT